MQFSLTALCAVGAEKIVSNELRKLPNMKIIEGGFGKARFQTDIEGLYTSLMALRTADRILLEAGRFSADNFDGLFEHVKSIAWEDFIPHDMGLHIAKVRSRGSALKSEVSVQAVVHKAAAERLCEKRRLNRLPEEKNAEIRVHIEKEQVFVLLDLSGDPLFKRGYRLEGGIAPLRETTAASIILLSLWRRKFSLFDPFCGSGTIAIEAALYAWNAAPGLGRNFAVSCLPFASTAVESYVREELAAKIDFNHPIAIYGKDSDENVIETAKANLKRAYEIALGHKLSGGMREELPFLPHFTVSQLGANLPVEDGGYLITNPPYGRRLGAKADAEALYGQMGAFCRRLPGWKICVITDHAGFESFFGRKADSCREITNGAIGSYFFQFSGSRE
ncbi:MAG: class I SAM-dependent RNA methyltransferase [Treponema sp.]|jgi:putative N6-adenine-specific DNA methylase|nr:class I SAM-dependent RNA methyltransferase [Treponema sp.]